MTTYHSFSSASWPTTCLGAWKNVVKVPNHKVDRRPKCLSFFFLFFSSSDRLVQNCVTLSRWFSHKEAFYNEQCTNPCFITTLKPHKAVRITHWTTMVSLATPFSCMRTKHLATKLLLFKIWFRNTVVCMKTGRVFGIDCYPTRAFAAGVKQCRHVCVCVCMCVCVRVFVSAKSI